jgi:hypothetical protein
MKECQVVQICDHRRETEAGESGVPGQPGLHREILSQNNKIKYKGKKKKKRNANLLLLLLYIIIILYNYIYII